MENDKKKKTKKKRIIFGVIFLAIGLAMILLPEFGVGVLDIKELILPSVSAFAGDDDSILVDRSGSTETYRNPDGTLTKTLYSGTMFTHEDGDWVTLPEVSTVTWVDGAFRIAYRNYWVDIEPLVVYNGNLKTVADIQQAFPNINVVDYATPMRFNHKFAINFTNVPQNLMDNVDYFVFNLKGASGLTWADVEKTGEQSLVIKDKIEISYRDLIDSGYTLNLINKTTLLIGNISENLVDGVLSLDPTIQLKDENSENLNDVSTYSQNYIFSPIGTKTDLHISKNIDFLINGGYDTSENLVNISGILIKQGFSSPENITNIQVLDGGMIYCLEATTITTKVYEGATSPDTLVHTGSSDSCNEGGFTINIGYTIPSTGTYWVGFEADSNITLALDSTGETKDWYYNNSHDFVQQDNVAYSFYGRYGLYNSSSYFMFDTTSIPSGSSVSNGILCSYAEFCSGTINFTSYKVTEEWDEDDTYYNNTPADAGTLLGSISLGTADDGKYNCINVTDGIDVVENNSFVIKFDDLTSDNDDYCRITSKEEAGSQDPYLNITYSYTACDSGVCYLDSSHILEDVDMCEGLRACTDNGGIVKFNISSICDSGYISIDNVQMQLYIASKSGSPDSDMNTWYIDDQGWLETASAATLEALSLTNDSTVTLSSTDASSFTNITITNLTKEACNLGRNNLSIRFEDPDYPIGTIQGTGGGALTTMTMGQETGVPANQYQFSTKEETTDNYRPIIYVEYTEPGGDVPPAIQGTLPEEGDHYNNIEIVNFTCNVTKETNNVMNTTLYIYNISEDIYYNETNITELSSTQKINFSEIHIKSNGDEYKYSCRVTDSSNTIVNSDNITFRVTNSSIPELDTMLDSYYGYAWHYNYSIDNGTQIDFKPPIIGCNFTDEVGLRYVGMMWDNYLESSYYWDNGLFTNNEINFTDTSNYPTSYNLSMDVGDWEWNQTQGEFRFRCFAQSINFSKTLIDNHTIIINITPEVYVVYAVDTETASFYENIHNQTLALGNFDFYADKPMWNSFYNDTTGVGYAEGRKYNDSYNEHPKVTWFDMVTRAYWYNENGLTNDPIWEYIDNFTTEINYFGDEMTAFHYHQHYWFNTSAYEEDYAASVFDSYPYNGSSTWTQFPDYYDELPVAISHNDDKTTKENIEEIWANRIIVSQAYPSTYRSGWLWENTNFSNWMEDIIKYDWSMWKGAYIGRYYNWSLPNVQEWTPYHPSSEDYQERGNMSRWLFPCMGGNYGLDDANNSAKIAYNISRAVTCRYTHNFGPADPIGNSLTQVYNQMNNSINQLTPTYTFKFATAHEASKWFERCDDDVTPDITIVKDNDWIYLNSSEELYSEPFLAILDLDGTYLKGTLELDGTDDNGNPKWKASRSQANIQLFSIGSTDLCGNTEVSTEEIVDDAQIVYPTTEEKETVYYKQNITVNFTSRRDGSYLTTGLNITNITVNDIDCKLIGNATFTSDIYWTQNCSVPELNVESNYDLKIIVNQSDYVMALYADTEIEAVHYPSPVNITYPTTTDTLSTSSATKIGINYTFYADGVELTNGVSVNNITINGTDCKISEVCTYYDSSWHQNCTTPTMGSGVLIDLYLEANNTPTNIHNETEINSITYGCWEYIAGSKFLKIPKGCLFTGALNNLFGIFSLPLLKNSLG